MPLQATAGQVVINSLLPADLQDYGRVLDKQEIGKLLSELARRYDAETYRQVSYALMDAARQFATQEGGSSFGPQHLKRPQQADEKIKALEQSISRVLSDKRTSPEHKKELIIRYATRLQKQLADELVAISEAEDNPLYHQLRGAGRGNKVSLLQLRGAPLMYTDHRAEPIPFAVVRNYAQGLAPAEYFAASFGARQGVLATKFAVRDAGDLSKRLQQSAHRLLVTRFDWPPNSPYRGKLGMPVFVNDPDNVGAVLAMDAGPYKAGTVLTPKILSDLENQGIKKVAIRSPILPSAEDGGLYAVDLGLRERGDFPRRYEQVGIQAVQTATEPLTQSQLNVKHMGGAAQARSLTGFTLIDALATAPEHIFSTAVHSETDGTVKQIRPSPAGGYVVQIGEASYHVPTGMKLRVHEGKEVEAGDVISSGLPHPAIITRYKGLGEGRRYLAFALRKAFEDAGILTHRRNAEVLARALVNHVRITDENYNGIPHNTILPYEELLKIYVKPPTTRRLSVRQAVGKYLQDNYLHHTIGTRLGPKMAQELEEFGIKEVEAADEPPGFEPVMIGAGRALHYDPDWMVRMLGSYQRRTVVQAAQTGAVSDLLGTSFVPARAYGVHFGRAGLVRPPQEWGYQPTPVEKAEEQRTEKALVREIHHL